VVSIGINELMRPARGFCQRSTRSWRPRPRALRTARHRRIVLDWTVALFFRPDITRVDLRVEREQVKQARRLVERSSE
jgi:hypothetical protein